MEMYREIHSSMPKGPFHEKLHPGIVLGKRRGCSDGHESIGEVVG